MPSTKSSKNRSAVRTEVCKGNKSITVDKAKKLLGWRELKDGDNSPSVPEIKTLLGRKVTLSSNMSNRPINLSSLRTLVQELGNGRWRFNGEPIIIGVEGSVLNGQHSLIALVVVNEWMNDRPEEFELSKAGAKSVIMDKLIVYGVEEDDSIINTMDTCRPRTLADVIYRASYFSSRTPRERKNAARATQYAVKKLWEATGDGRQHIFKPTHAEYIAFIDSHPKVLEAVEFIFNEYKPESPSCLTPGVCAAALFLAASGETNPIDYYQSEPLSEQAIDFTLWDKACEFFVELLGGSKSTSGCAQAICQLMEDGIDGPKHRWVTVAKAWQAYRSGKKLTQASCLPKFLVQHGAHSLAEYQSFGGIDLGEEGLQMVQHSDPDPDDIQQVARALKTDSGTETLKSLRSSTGWNKGDTAWHHPNGVPASNAAYVRLLGKPYNCQDGVTRVLCDADNGACELQVSELSTSQFELTSC